LAFVQIGIDLLLNDTVDVEIVYFPHSILSASSSVSMTSGKTAYSWIESQLIYRPRKALKRFIEERDLLKKAAAYFAKQSELGMPPSKTIRTAGRQDGYARY
jgi:hypothetical protein